MMDRADGQSGFSLVEVIVSFAILTLSLIILFRTISDGTRNIAVIEAREEVLAIARAKIAEAGHAIPLQSGEYVGVSPAGYSWSVNIAPYLGNQKESRASAWWVRVRVASTGRRKTEIILKTIKLGRGTDE